MDNLNIYYNKTFNSMTDFVDFFMDKAKLYNVFKYVSFIKI